MTELKTRKPTGKPSWPMLLLAGGEKCGKSYAAAALSASDLIDRTFWIEIGEGSADQYGALPGARYEIVEHDGSYPSMLAAAEQIVKVPVRGSRPHAVVVDSMTELWDLLSDEQAAVAAKRGKSVITMDQWNTAKKRWRKFVDVLRKNSGPVIFTARFEQVTVVEGGKPVETTTANGGKEAKKQWKIRAEKNLPFEVDGIIEIPKPRKFYVEGIRSVKFEMPEGGHREMPPGFTLDQFLRDLGLVESGTTQRNFTPLQQDLDGAEGDSRPRGTVSAADILGSSPPPPDDEPGDWPDVPEIPR